MTTSTPRHGGCHCGALRIAFTLQQAAADTSPRACDCDFCRKHGAAWVSDPAGRLRVRAREGALQTYRQGSETAQFCLCAHCGVLVIVRFTHEGRVFGAVNATCLDDGEAFAPAQAASPQRLDPAAKALRWRTLWIPDVELTTSD